MVFLHVCWLFIYYLVKCSFKTFSHFQMSCLIIKLLCILKENPTFTYNYTCFISLYESLHLVIMPTKTQRFLIFISLFTCYLFFQLHFCNHTLESIPCHNIFVWFTLSLHHLWYERYISALSFEFVENRVHILLPVGIYLTQSSYPTLFPFLTELVFP